MTGLPPRLVDAHMHLWDLSLGRHPWLCAAPPIAFRYGDYAPIRRSYLAAGLSLRHGRARHRGDRLY